MARKLKSNNAPLVVALFLVAGALVSGAWLGGKTDTTKERQLSRNDLWVKTAQAETSEQAVLKVDDVIVSGSLVASENESGVYPLDYVNGAIKDSGF